MGETPIKLIYVVNEASFLISHRLALATEALARGFQVMVVCAEGTGEEHLAQYGLSYQTMPLTRSGLNPLQELRTLKSIRKVYEAERPDIVHHVTIKPVLYGTRAANRAGIRAVVNAVPGMGFVFIRRGVLAAIRRAFVNLLYRLALSHRNMQVIFQNQDDMEGFISHAIVDREQSTLIRGSGVDLETFRCAAEPRGAMTFLLVGRMLRHKGVREFVEAAKTLRKTRPDWRFQLVGDVDAGNPASLTQEELGKWQDAGLVEWLGHRSDVPQLMANAHVVCLPSYREGLPKTLLEAAATGRAMVSSDAAGCREVVRNEVTGLVVPVRDADSLARAMFRLGEDKELRQRFGRAARAKAEAVFSVEDVVSHTFRVYERLLSK
ncbi:MAG: glycosyltransferase family 4 protein [Gammaproteobacteria bacterium]|nr:glycosyltransferase family 4 protein [Gammaproteobacteria bacterium]